MYQRAAIDRGDDDRARLREQIARATRRADSYELACGILLRALGPFTAPNLKRTGPGGLILYEWPEASVEKLRAAAGVAWQYMCQAEGTPPAERPAPVTFDAEDLARRALEAARAHADDVAVAEPPAAGTAGAGGAAGDVERCPDTRAFDDEDGDGDRNPDTPNPAEPPPELAEFGLDADALDRVRADGLPWQVVCPVEDATGRPCGATLFLLSRMALEPGQLAQTLDLFRTMRERHTRRYHPNIH